MSPTLSRWLILGEWRAHPVRTAVAIAAVALGVALGYAIHLINASALAEFGAALRGISGEADLSVQPEAAGALDEAIYPELATLPGVAVASPIVEVSASIPGRREALTVLGVDVFQAGAIAPDLVGIPDDAGSRSLLADDALFLSPAAMEWLGVKPGDAITIRVGLSPQTLRVAGGLTRARAGQRLGVMDIGAAQWRLDRLGRLSRVDLKLEPGVDRRAFRDALAARLPAGALVVEPGDREQRVASLSRAYRVNLNVLSLVALFTGAFLVFSTQALAVVRRRAQLALLRVSGVTRGELLALVLCEGAAVGAAGAALGLALGHAAAASALSLFGGDLGGGYFPGVRPRVHVDPRMAALYFTLGVAASVGGSLGPARAAARARPAEALKAGDGDLSLGRLRSPLGGLLLLAAGAALSFTPPIAGLPILAYAAIALLLLGGIALLPWLAALGFGRLARLGASRPVPALALGRLAAAHDHAAVALGGVLASFSLMVAMSVMVASFRGSVDEWLRHVLPADLYVRAGGAGDTAYLPPRAIDAIAGAPGVARAELLRAAPVSLDPARPSVALIVRPIDPADPAARLPLTGPALAASALEGHAPVYVSEAMVDLYGFTLGRDVTLPVAGAPRPFRVAGVWRDYARQFGAVVVPEAAWAALGGDGRRTEAALWLAPGATPAEAAAALRGRLGGDGDGVEITEPGEIRARTLQIFDRSFAITTLLELAALVIGLFGVATTFGAQALARSREFGMLRHLGVTRREIAAALALEGGLLSLLGVVFGLLLGGAMSLVLIHVINPQSFHWTMELHVPWPLLGGAAALLSLASAATAALAGRHALSVSAVRAVREDW